MSKPSEPKVVEMSKMHLIKKKNLLPTQLSRKSSASQNMFWPGTSEFEVESEIIAKDNS